MALEATAQGPGVALARLLVSAGDIAAGRFAPLGRPETSDRAYLLVAWPGALRQRDAPQFAAWLQEELTGTEPAA
jgi:DNA-binding transcriptional LysR family regulator